MCAGKGGSQMKTPGAKSHNERKNYRMAELFAKQRFEKNAARSKQKFDSATKTWSR
jgi:hypothetical protein